MFTFGLRSFFKEFKAFAVKGNVMELAIAVVIGGAFGKIVTSLVNNIITPLMGLLLGGVNFAGLSYKVENAVISYGDFIQSIIDFIIVAFAIFFFMKVINKAQKAVKARIEAGEKVEEVQPVPSEEVLLLREIRDSLKRQ